MKRKPITTATGTINEFGEVEPFLPLTDPTTTDNRVLVCGVQVHHPANTVMHMQQTFQQSVDWQVEQLWALTSQPDKFQQFNNLTDVIDLSEDRRLDQYRYILFVDDDVQLPAGFVDRYLACVSHYGFALAQPARTQHSVGSHRFVFEDTTLIARETRFVECGPVFSVHRSAYRVLLPFDVAVAGMGIGRDFCWPVALAAQGLTCGIVDSVPVDHTLRPHGITYRPQEMNAKMSDYYQTHVALAPRDAFVTVRAWPRQDWVVKGPQ